MSKLAARRYFIRPDGLTQIEWWDGDVEIRADDPGPIWVLDSEAYVKMLEARLEAAERVVEAAQQARIELGYAPCRDNPQHTLCLKCAAEKALDEALAAWEEAKRDVP